MERPPTLLEMLGLDDPLSKNRQVSENLTVGDIRNRLEEKEHPDEVTKIYLFGSRARGDWTEDSDWDIFVRYQTENTRGGNLAEDLSHFEEREVYKKESEIRRNYLFSLPNTLNLGPENLDVIVDFKSPLEWKFSNLMDPKTEWASGPIPRIVLYKGEK